MKKIRIYSFLFLLPWMTGCATFDTPPAASGAGLKEGVPLRMGSGTAVSYRFLGLTSGGNSAATKAIENALAGSGADDMSNMVIDRIEECMIPILLCYVTTTVRGVLVKYPDLKKTP